MSVVNDARCWLRVLHLLNSSQSFRTMHFIFEMPCHINTRLQRNHAIDAKNETDPFRKQEKTAISFHRQNDLKSKLDTFRQALNRQECHLKPTTYSSLSLSFHDLHVYRSWRSSVESIRRRRRFQSRRMKSESQQWVVCSTTSITLLLSTTRKD